MNTERRGILIVVSGFSGAGKGTIMKRLMEDYQGQYALSVSATTRAPRAGEVHGREYFFLSEEEFQSMIDREELIEYARYVNHYYGTPKSYVKQQLELGKDVILEIEIQGALHIKEKFPDALLLFVTTPTAQELRERLTGRGTEDEATILSRLVRATEEAEGIEAYDYLIINDDLEQCVRQVHTIIENEHYRIGRNTETIANMRQELISFVKGE